MRFADRTAVIVILLPQEGGVIVAASADLEQSLRIELGLDLGHLQSGSEPGRKLRGQFAWRLGRGVDAEPYIDIEVLDPGSSEKGARVHESSI